ncbi:MAG: preprotein translocase subunit YajC [Spirochaetaceae bacterium]|jgi:preprotein translocase subunit YajC|nr:preprotein translocase subunit YajC [Spirochaetaceae bacterium]
MDLGMLPLLMGVPDGAAAGGGGASALVQMVPFVLIIGIFYFLIIRPQNKKQKETQRMLEALKKGDKIVTIGGVHGVIQSVKERSVIVKVDDYTKIEFSRNAISSVEAAGKDEKAEKDDDSSKKEDSSAEKSEKKEEKKKFALPFAKAGEPASENGKKEEKTNPKE